MQIIVVSDNHGRSQPIKDIKNMYPDADLFIHCGDSEMYPEALEGFVAVAGNNDGYNFFPDEKIIDIQGLKILVCHGDNYFSAHRVDLLKQRAKEEKFNLVCFGHTHAFFCKIEEGVCILNPGSITFNRDYSAPSYAIVSYTNGKLEVERKEYIAPPKEKKGFFNRK